MLETLNANKDRPAKEQLDKLKENIDSFVDGNDPFDDVTMLLFGLFDPLKNSL